MKVVQLIRGTVVPALPVRRYVNMGHANPGLSFTHPYDQPANWHVIIPLGAIDFYADSIPCPTFPGRGETCRYCGTKIVNGKCSGRVPPMPTADQSYSLVPLRAAGKDGSLFLAAKEKPEDEKGLIVLWDDYDPSTTALGYDVFGEGSIIAYGHDNEAGATIVVFPVVRITGDCQLTSSSINKDTGEPVVYDYYFNADGLTGVERRKV